MRRRPRQKLSFLKPIRLATVFSAGLLAHSALAAANADSVPKDRLPPVMQPATKPTRAEVDTALQQLLSRRPDDRRDAADALRRMGADAAPARAALSKAVGDESPAVQVAAAEAFAASFGRGTQAVDSLLLALKDDRELIRIAAAGRLSVIGQKDAGRIVPALVPLLGDKQPAVRAKAANAIGLLADAAPDEAAKAVAPLVKLLTDRQDPAAWEQRFDAANALLRIGPGAKTAYPAVADALRSPDVIPYFRHRLIPLLPRLADKTGLKPLLSELARDKDPEVAQAASALAAAPDNPATTQASPR
ncbi:HEAT repeat domain-containing protein [Humisphaera borealis]|uniref:HEAT repeat domain-containing protein n=1 Tax=Humisphaera borealis TaxID=2807512 RepID=A0A7M2WSC6_9BACT|nr:HEAT repeat domain-containing protein [Humisphaera borealis]QOV88319.1 HEAT repeat domain-containing protein [Humisphaera borealis]